MSASKHPANHPTRYPSQAVVPPIELSTTFIRDPDGTYPAGYSYTRSGNPNRQQLEASLLELEDGAEAIAFASGTAATMAILMCLGTGDHVLMPEESYYGTQETVRRIFPRWGLGFDFIDMTDLKNVKAALTPRTKLIWVETPSNPRLRITDLTAIADLAAKNKAMVVCDNTLATPLNQNPLRFGCDLVLHSTTKYLNGHSDALGGVVIARVLSEFTGRLRAVQTFGGGVPAPFDCWLISRGLATLSLRVDRQCDNAQKIAEFLEAQPGITVVHYPGLPSHPQHDLAKKQMRRGGGLLSFEVAGGKEAAFEFISRLSQIRRATSLGGVETLIEHRASMEGPGTLTPPSLIRLAAGIEQVDEVIADLRTALKCLPQQGD